MFPLISSNYVASVKILFIKRRDEERSIEKSLFVGYHVEFCTFLFFFFFSRLNLDRRNLETL